MNFNEYNYLYGPGVRSNGNTLITAKDLINKEYRTLMLASLTEDDFIHVYLTGIYENPVPFIAAVTYDIKDKDSLKLINVRTNDDYLHITDRFGNAIYFDYILPEFSDFEFLNILARKGYALAFSRFLQKRYTEMEKQDGVYFGRTASYEDAKNFYDMNI